MKRVNAPGSRGGASLVEVTLSIVFILIIVLVIATMAGSVKDICVQGASRHEANKLSMYVLEKLLLLNYSATTPPLTDPHLNDGSYTIDNTEEGFLPVSDLSGYSISYTVTTRNWGTTTIPYKEIIVTTQWTHGNNTDHVTLGMLKRQAP